MNQKGFTNIILESQKDYVKPGGHVPHNLDETLNFLTDSESLAIREKIWYQRFIESNCTDHPSLLICGAEHLNPANSDLFFLPQLKKSGYDVEIIYFETPDRIQAYNSIEIETYIACYKILDILK